MSRRRQGIPQGDQRVELVLTCGGCGTDNELLRVGLDTFDESDRVIYWRVPPAAQHRVQLDSEAGKKIFIRCEIGHDIQLLTDTLERRLEQMWQPHRHAVEMVKV